MSELGLGIIFLTLGILVRYDAQEKINLFKVKISKDDTKKMKKYGFLISYIIIVISMFFLFLGYVELLPLEK